jgi:hypothetical protein
MGTGGSFPGVKRQRREADHSPPACAEVKKTVDLYLHFPIHLHGVVPYLCAKSLRLLRSAGMAINWTTTKTGFDSLQRQENILFSTTSSRAPGPQSAFNGYHGREKMTQIHLMQRLIVVFLYLHSPIRLHDVVLTQA